jgi:hypothetical protein
MVSNVISKFNKEQICKNDPYNKLLEKTNDYAIYSLLSGYEIPLKTLIKSPLRSDNSPTFSVFPPTRNKPKWEGQLIFKDFNGETGDVFKFAQMHARNVKSLHLNDKNEIIQYILNSFGEEVVLKPMDAPAINKSINYKISLMKRFKKCHLDYWEEHGVSKNVLNYYNVQPCEFLLNEYQQVVRDFRGTCTFAYIIFDKFKLYQPFEENFTKFFNQCPPDYIQGYQQCTTGSNTLLVTKAMKDILVYQSHTDCMLDIISPHGEGYIIGSNWIYWMLTNYNKIVIVFDPDHAGVKGANRLRKQLRSSEYYSDQLIKVRFVSTKRILKKEKWDVPVKDIADYRLIYGESKTKLKINQILEQ